MSQIAAILMTILIVALAGCSSAPGTQLDKVPCHPASGKLFIGGKAAKGASIIFVPKNEPQDSKTPRPRATVGDDGAFQLSTFDNGDGAPPGEYGLIIYWPGNEQDDQLNGRYGSPEKTGQKLKIVEGPNDLGAIKLK